MQLEHESLINLKKEILRVVKAHLPLDEYRVFFFGSRAAGTNMSKSDIDIGIEGPEKIPPKAFFEIMDELQKIPTFYKIDLVDFGDVSREFKEEATRAVELISY